MATARLRPVERLAGRASATSSAPTTSINWATLSSISSRSGRRARAWKGNVFADAEESKRAPFWKTMVTRLRMARKPSSLRVVISCLRREWNPHPASESPSTCAGLPTCPRAAAHDAEGLAAIDIEADVLQNGAAIEGDADVAEGDEGLRRLIERVGRVRIGGEIDMGLDSDYATGTRLRFRLPSHKY